MKEFLKENEVAVSGFIISILSAIIFYLRSQNAADEIFGIYLFTLAIPYGLAISLACIKKAQFPPQGFVFFYTLLSEAIYFGVIWLTSYITHSYRGSESIGLGISSAIGATLLLLLSQVMLHLQLTIIFHLKFFIFIALLETLLFVFEMGVLGHSILAVPIWQIVFALTLNEIIKRQDKLTLKN